jgi:hypothetical protein
VKQNLSASWPGLSRPSQGECGAFVRTPSRCKRLSKLGGFRTAWMPGTSPGTTRGGCVRLKIGQPCGRSRKVNANSSSDKSTSLCAEDRLYQARPPFEDDLPRLQPQLRGFPPSPPTSPNTRRTAAIISSDRSGRDFEAARAIATAPIIAAAIVNERARSSALSVVGFSAV